MPPKLIEVGWRQVLAAGLMATLGCTAGVDGLEGRELDGSAADLGAGDLGPRELGPVEPGEDAGGPMADASDPGDGGACDACQDGATSDAGPVVVPVPIAIGEVVPRALDWTRAGGHLAFTFATTNGPSASLARIDAEGNVQPWSALTAPQFEGAENIWLVRAGSSLFVVWTGADALARFARVAASGALGEITEVVTPTSAPSLHRVVDAIAIPENLFLVASTSSDEDAPRRVLRQSTSGAPSDLWPMTIDAKPRRRFLPVKDGSHAVGLWFEPTPNVPGAGWLDYGWFELNGRPRAESIRLAFYSGAGEEAFPTAAVLGAATTEQGLFVVISILTGIHGTSVWGLRRNDFGMSSGRIDPEPPLTQSYEFHHAEYLRGSVNEIVFGVFHPTSNPNRFWVDVHRINADRDSLGSARLERTATVVAYDDGFAVSCVGDTATQPSLRCRRQNIP